jgi:hypothetical protein
LWDFYHSYSTCAGGFYGHIYSTVATQITANPIPCITHLNAVCFVRITDVVIYPFSIDVFALVHFVINSQSYARFEARQLCKVANTFPFSQLTHS